MDYRILELFIKENDAWEDMIGRKYPYWMRSQYSRQKI
jgi:hypothetical protein